MKRNELYTLITNLVKRYIEEETRYYVEKINSQEKIIEDLRVVIGENKILITENTIYKTALNQAFKNILDKEYKMESNSSEDYEEKFEDYERIGKYLLRISPRDAALIYEHYINKLSFKAISVEYGLSDSRVSQIVKRTNYYYLRGKVFDDVIDELKSTDYLGVK